eukprot:c54207_g1_i1 orf=220-564(+)
MPVVKRSQQLGRGKQILEAHRTVRQILRRQHTADEGYEADVFAAVESVDPSTGGPTRHGSPSLALQRRVAQSMNAIVTPRMSLRPNRFGAETGMECWRPTSAYKINYPSILANS